MIKLKGHINKNIKFKNWIIIDAIKQKWKNLIHPFIGIVLILEILIINIIILEKYEINPRGIIMIENNEIYIILICLICLIIYIFFSIHMISEDKKMLKRSGRL